MALMTEERRKEMEEEMSRFELEILAPGGGRGKGSIAHAAVASKDKPLSPPPPPPSAVTSRLPEVAVLAKAPPPPPPHSPPVQTILRPPPPPPMISAQPSPSVQFIPHQLHRQPSRPQMRPNFMGMRGPMPGHHQQFHPSNNYGPPMGMGGPHMPQHHMHHGPHPMHGMPHGGMHMPHPMNMGVSLPMPPGFCAPGPPMGHNMGYDQQYDHHGNNEEPEDPATENENSNENPSVVASAPTIYAAPFVKNQPDVNAEAPSGNVQESVSTAVPPVVQKPEKVTFGKSTVGPVMPTGNEEAVVSKKREKKKKIVRMAGGQAWEDNSLLEWESDDFRIFCGDLGNDVTDEVLIRAFSKYTSFIKAKVVRDKRTNKTKGFGFVSFKDPQDFIKAMREMNGRYVGSRPIKLRKSTWRDRNIDVVKKKQREKEKLGMM